MPKVISVGLALCQIVVYIVVAIISIGSATADDKLKVELVSKVGHDGYIRSVAMSADGRIAISGGDDTIPRLWDVATGELLRSFEGHSGYITSVAFSPDGANVLTGSSDRTLKLWEVATGTLLRVFEGHSDSVTAICFSSNGRMVLSGSQDRTLKLWDVSSGKVLRSFANATRYVSSVALTPDDKTVLAGGGALSVWDARTGDLLSTFGATRTTSGRVAFSPDLKQAIFGDSGALTIVNLENSEKRQIAYDDLTFITSLAISPDGRHALVAHIIGVLLIDIASGQLLRKFIGKAHSITSIAFSADGRTAIAGGRREVMLWDISTAQLQKTFNAPFRAIKVMALSPNEGKLISGHDDGTLRFWDTASWRPFRVIKAFNFPISIAVFAPDGRSVLAGSDGELELKLWDVGTGELLQTFSGLTVVARSVAFSPDGRSFVAGGGALTLWNVITGKQSREFVGRDYNPVISVAFSPDGRTVLAGGTEGQELWDITTGTLIGSFDRRRSWARSVSVSPDGLTSVSLDGGADISIWDAKTGVMRRKIGGGPWHSATFSRDGRTLFARGQSLAILDSHSGNLIQSMPIPIKSPVVLSRNAEFAIIGKPTGLIDVWNFRRVEKIVTVGASQAAHWISMTPAGFFSFDGNVEGLVHLVRGLEVFSISQTFEHLYRPDLVEAMLNGDLEGRHRDASHHLNLNDVLLSGPAPQIEHLNETVDRAGDSIRLSVRITGTGGGVGKRITWKVNGVTQGMTNPSALANLNGPLASAVITETLRLAPGQQNVIEVTAYNSKGLVATPPARITVDDFGASTSERPRMFVLALGINKYRMKEYQLSYATSDAISVAKALSVVGSSLFSEVKAKTLTDEAVSEAGISGAIDQIAREAKPEDVFVLFLGGHGKSIAGRYFYYPQTLDFGARQSVEQYAIGQDKWEAWLARIPVQKSLLLIDTCEGDAFRGSRGTDSARQTAMTQLQHATGRNIIAASREAAYEGYKGHGLLTYAILEALDKKASAGGDDRVRVSALAEHIGVRVPEISRSSFGILQNPTRKLTGNDFPIGIRQPLLADSAGGAPAIPKEPTHVLIRAELLREQPAVDAPGSRELAPGMQVRAVEFLGAWVIVARDGQKLGYIPVEALVRLQ